MKNEIEEIKHASYLRVVNFTIGDMANNSSDHLDWKWLHDALAGPVPLSLTPSGNWTNNTMILSGVASLDNMDGFEIRLPLRLVKMHKNSLSSWGFNVLTSILSQALVPKS